MSTPDLIKISELPAAVGPLDPAALVPISQGGVTYRFPGASIVLPSYSLLTVAPTGALTGGRSLLAGTGISFTDGGPGGQFTISCTVSGGTNYTSAIAAIPTAVENNYNPTGWAAALGKQRLQLTPAGASTVSGILASSAVNGQAVVLSNDSATQLITLSHDATSTAANRFWCPGGADFILIPFQAVLIVYDGINSRWRIVA